MRKLGRCTILLVEDDPNDVMLITRVFERSKIINPFQKVDNGEDAIKYLSGSPPYDDRERSPVPTLILLDLNLPRKTGFDVLKWRMTKEEIKRIPVVVLTTSKESTDVSMAYDLGANSYLVKPVSFDDVLYMVNSMNLSWCILSQDGDCMDDHGPGQD